MDRSGSAESVTWVECPRDAWQGLPGSIPTAMKARHLTNLLMAGFTHLDMGSFVSARAVPQMADTEAVLALLDPPPGADLLCIIGNERGLERARAAKGVTSVGYPLSLSETFQRRNVGAGLAESWRLVERLADAAGGAGLQLVVYLSMGFGNPYGELWTPADTAAAVARLRQLGVGRIALADTVGRADARVLRAVLGAVDAPEALGLHLHARRDDWRGLADAALAAGIRWLEGAFGGIGGCPFADDELVGNLPTEDVMPYLAAAGYSSGVALDRLDALSAEARALASAP